MNFKDRIVEETDYIVVVGVTESKEVEINIITSFEGTVVLKTSVTEIGADFFKGLTADHEKIEKIVYGVEYDKEWSNEAAQEVLDNVFNSGKKVHEGDVSSDVAAVMTIIDRIDEYADSFVVLYGTFEEI